MFTRINKYTFYKELQCLVEIGVLTPVQQSQHVTPIFIISKKEGTLRFITNYCRLKQQLVIKTHMLPIIGKNVHHM